MSVIRFIRSQAHAVYALLAVFLGAAALTAVSSFVPDQAPSALRSLIPADTPFFQLLLLGGIGVGLGLFDDQDAAERGQSAAPAAKARRELAERDETVDRVLRQVARRCRPI